MTKNQIIGNNGAVREQTLAKGKRIHDVRTAADGITYSEAAAACGIYVDASTARYYEMEYTNSVLYPSLYGVKGSPRAIENTTDIVGLHWHGVIRNVKTVKDLHKAGIDTLDDLWHHTHAELKSILNKRGYAEIAELMPY